MISNFNDSGLVRVLRKKAVFTGSRFGFGSVIKFYEFESGEIRHYKLKFCSGPFKICEIEAESFATL